MDLLFNKIQNKKQQREDPSSVEQNVINLGLVKAMHSKITANELAAKGIKLSIKNNLVEFIKKLDADQQTKETAELLNLLEQPATGEQAKTANEEVPMQINTCTVPPKYELQKKTPFSR